MIRFLVCSAVVLFGLSLLACVDDGGPALLPPTAPSAPVASTVPAVLQLRGPDSLAVGETVRFAAVLVAPDGSAQAAAPVTWSSGNPVVAVARAGGLVTGVGVGRFDLRVRYMTHTTGLFGVSVVPAPLPWSWVGTGISSPLQNCPLPNFESVGDSLGVWSTCIPATALRTRTSRALLMAVIVNATAAVPSVRPDRGQRSTCVVSPMAVSTTASNSRARRSASTGDSCRCFAI